MFKRELKNTIKNELMRDEREYESLEELIEIVIDLDDKLYKRVIKKRFDDESREKTSVFMYRFVENDRKKDDSVRKLYYETMSMKLNSTERKKKNLRVKQNKTNKTYISDDEEICNDDASSTKSAVFTSEKEYYFVKNLTVFQQVLNETASDNTSVSTQKINTTIEQKQKTEFDDEFE
ncbi:MAG: hypothetical protein Q9191_008118 [Dirinaria sp. TL-2023a]